MPATKAHLVFDFLANLQMIVLPDDDTQLDDPAFSPSGTISVKVPLAGYQGCGQQVDILQLAVGPLMAANHAVGILLQQQIQDMNNPPGSSP